MITSIDRLNLGVLTTLYKQGFRSFWSAVNGPFLLPLFLGIMTSILFMSSAIDYLLVHHPIILWSFFCGLITASILLLIRQLEKKHPLPYSCWRWDFVLPLA